MGELTLSIVLPAYNESARLLSSLEGLTDHVDLGSTEIIVVDDGSTDDTAVIAEAALRDAPCHRVLHLDTNRGKGAAIRAGVLEATGPAVVYMDADLATDLNDLKKLLLALDGADVAVGSRTATDAIVINGTWSRSVMARVFNLMARRVTRLPLRDTQCGFKAFRTEIARELFSRSRIDGFAFDVEILALAQRMNLRIVEVPVTWTAIHGSSVRNIRDPLQMTRDIFRIARRLRRTPGPAESATPD